MRKQARFMGAILFLLVAATACGAAAVESTAVSPPANTPSANDHVDDPNDPAHIHLDDGSTLSTEGTAPLEEDIWELLLAGDPIVVGAANESVSTAVFTIPTMF